MFVWLAHLAFIGFFTFISWIFLSAIKSNIFKLLVISMGILFIVQITIADLGPVVQRWNNTIDSITDTVQRAAGKDGWDMPVKGTITQDYAPPDHHGIDIAVPSGTMVYAQDSGTVILAEYQHVYGEVVVIQYDNGYQALYAHLSKMYVKYGDKVQRDPVITTSIGKTGSTGKSDGPHLHYEIRRSGIAINPYSIIDK